MKRAARPTETAEEQLPASTRLKRSTIVPFPATMVLLAALLFLQGAGSVGSVPGSPENVTVVFLNATSVKVTWDTTLGQAEKYDVVYKPTDASYRVVAVVAGNTGAVTLDGLQADRQYQVSVAAVRAGRKFRSRPVVFRTLDPRNQSHASGTAIGPVVAATGGTFQVRGIEVCIVLLVLAVWAGAIALFFNRWGKIRMLLPYQPDYKEQMKAAAAAAAGGQPPPGGAAVVVGPATGPGGVPGGGVAPPSIACPQSGQSCSQHLHWSRLATSSSRFDYLPPGARFSRPRINSVFAAYSAGGGAGGSSWGGFGYGNGVGGMGARSHYGGSKYGGIGGGASTGGPYGGLYFAASNLSSSEFPACRKARSAENIPMGPLVVLPTPPGDEGSGGDEENETESSTNGFLSPQKPKTPPKFKKSSEGNGLEGTEGGKEAN